MKYFTLFIKKIKNNLKKYWRYKLKMIYYYLSLRKGQNKIKQLKKISWQSKTTLVDLRSWKKELWKLNSRLIYRIETNKPSQIFR